MSRDQFEAVAASRRRQPRGVRRRGGLRRPAPSPATPAATCSEHARSTIGEQGVPRRRGRVDHRRRPPDRAGSLGRTGRHGRPPSPTCSSTGGRRRRARPGGAELGGAAGSLRGITGRARRAVRAPHPRRDRGGGRGGAGKSSTTAPTSPRLPPSGRSTRRAAETGGALEAQPGQPCIPLDQAQARSTRPFFEPAAGAVPGIPIGPVQTQFGWHVILARPVRRGRGGGRPGRRPGVVRATTWRAPRSRSTPATGAGTPPRDRRRRSLPAASLRPRGAAEWHDRRRRARARGDEHVTVETLSAIERIPHRYLRTTRHPSAHLVARPRLRRSSTSRPTASTRSTPRSSSSSSAPPPIHGEVLYAVPGSPAGARAHRAARSFATTGSTSTSCRRCRSSTSPGPASASIPSRPACSSSTATTSPRRAPAPTGPLLIAHTHADWVLSDVKLAVEHASRRRARRDPPAPRHARRVRSPTRRWSELDRAVDADHLTCVYVPRTRRADRRRLRPPPRTGPHAARALPVGHRADPRQPGAAPGGGDVRARRRDRPHSIPTTRRPRRRSSRSSATCCTRSSSTPRSPSRKGASRSPTSPTTMHDKLVRRHPHVFGDVAADDAEP